MTKDRVQEQGNGIWDREGGKIKSTEIQNSMVVDDTLFIGVVGDNAESQVWTGPWCTLCVMLKTTDENKYYVHM